MARIILCQIIPNEKWIRKVIVAEIHQGAKSICSLLGIHIRLIHPPQISPPYIICANHVSYLDPVIIPTYFPCHGITSTDTRNDGVLGKLIGFLRCPLVSRKVGKNMAHELRQVSLYTRDGHSIQFYPEATSTNGEALRPFHSCFFQIPFQDQLPVLPISIRYIRINGENLNTSNRDWIYYYGSMQFLPHLKQLLKLRTIEVDLICHPPLHPSQFSHRKDLCKEAQRMIENGLQDF